MRSSDTQDFTWTSNTYDTRALERPESTTNPPGRIAACWYYGGQFSLDVTIHDGQLHQVALYFLDWDNYHGRAETITVSDPTTGQILDQRAMTSFVDGKYLVWRLSGSVSIGIENTNNSSNAVVSGIFFG